MTLMDHAFRRNTLFALLACGSLVPAAGVFAADDQSPLEIKLPIPAFMGTPTDIPLNEHIEKPSDKPRAPFLAPKGAKVLSTKKKVTLSDKSPINGSAELVTDGNKEAGDANVLEMHRKLQWVQIDLEAPNHVDAVLVWHAHDTPQICKDVIVQVADDPDFTNNVRTLYNNDYDNTAGLGVGKDKEYFENYEGRLIDGKGEVGRYVRLYSQGSTYTALNRYTEVEVFGRPAK
jgi:hypothetical protein